MSKVECIDLAALQQRLTVAIEGTSGIPGSLYLHAMGAMYLATTPEATAELGLWASLFDLQAQIENVNGAEVLSSLVEIVQ